MQLLYSRKGNNVYNYNIAGSMIGVGIKHYGNTKEVTRGSKWCLSCDSVCFIRQVREKEGFQVERTAGARAGKGMWVLSGVCTICSGIAGYCIPSVTYSHTSLSSHHCWVQLTGLFHPVAECESQQPVFPSLHPSQSVSPSRPLPSLTTWAARPESCPSRRGHLCCFTSGLPTTGGKAGTTASTVSSPISTSWSKTRT